MSSAILQDYLGRGILADRPLPASLSIPLGTLSVYYATDTDEYYLLNDDGTAWVLLSGGGGGGGSTPWYFNPPLASHFTGAYNSAGSPLALTDDGDVGLLVDATGLVTGAETIVYVAPPVGVDWEVSCHIICDTVPYDYWDMGLYMIETSTHKMIQMGLGTNNGLWTDTVRSNASGFQSRGATQRVSSTSIFLRFHYNNATTTFTSYYSYSGKQWTLYDTFSKTSFFSSGPDGVGLGATFEKCKFVCDMWEQSW